MTRIALASMQSAIAIERSDGIQLARLNDVGDDLPKLVVVFLDRSGR